MPMNACSKFLFLNQCIHIPMHELKCVPAYSILQSLFHSISACNCIHLCDMHVYYTSSGSEAEDSSDDELPEIKLTLPDVSEKEKYEAEAPEESLGDQFHTFGSLAKEIKSEHKGTISIHKFSIWDSNLQFFISLYQSPKLIA